MQWVFRNNGHLFQDNRLSYKWALRTFFGLLGIRNNGPSEEWTNIEPWSWVGFRSQRQTHMLTLERLSLKIQNTESDNDNRSTQTMARWPNSTTHTRLLARGFVTIQYTVHTAVNHQHVTLQHLKVINDLPHQLVEQLHLFLISAR